MLYTAYHTALFVRCQGKLPKLESILIDEDTETTEKTPQTTEEMISMCRLITAAYGGSEVIN
jgi:hypothetical protein